jgi:hypothetical protein
MFHYKIGDISTKTPLKKPTREGIEVWWSKFKDTPHLSDYEVYIGGAVLNNVDTWDVDIFLTGKIKYFNELHNILNTAVQLGFKHWLLVDIKWVSNIHDDNETENLEREEIRNHNKVENNSKIKKYPGTQIYPGLYKSIRKPNPWGKKMLKEGKYKLGIAKMDTYIIYNEST